MQQLVKTVYDLKECLRNFVFIVKYLKAKKTALAMLGHVGIFEISFLDLHFTIRLAQR